MDSEEENTSAILATPAAVTFAIALALAYACTGGGGALHEDEAPDASGDAEAPPPIEAGPVYADLGVETAPATTWCAVDGGDPVADVTLERVFDQVVVEHPTAMAMAPGDASRWFVARRDGGIVSFAASAATGSMAAPVMVADVAQLAGKPVHQELEGGLLGFAFHPRFAQNGRLYVSFTTDGSVGYGSEVGYISSNDQGGSFTSYTRVLLFDRPSLEHNGGGITFGGEGSLYVSFGDGANELNGQSKNVTFGKILRLDVDDVPPGSTYGIPITNPFVAVGGDPTVYAWGLRNPSRLSVDRATGELWVEDVGGGGGGGAYEEIDRVVRGGNYGWPCRDGLHPHTVDDPVTCPVSNAMTDPVVEHAHGAGPRSTIAGGVVYRGSSLSGWQGRYVYAYADPLRAELRAVTADPAAAAATLSVDVSALRPALSSFAEDAAGELYALSTSQGRFYRLVRGAANAVAAPTSSASASASLARTLDCP